MRGDIKTELTEYITQNQERFYRLAYSYVQEREGALDIVQNAVVKALEHYQSIRSPEYLGTWFYRVLVNECCSYMRKRKREIAYEPEALSRMRDKEAWKAEDEGIYEQVLKLPDKMKTVIILRFYEEFTLEEIARATKSGLSTVKYRLYTGLKQMERSMKEESQ